MDLDTIEIAIEHGTIEIAGEPVAITGTTVEFADDMSSGILYVHTEPGVTIAVPFRRLQA